MDAIEFVVFGHAEPRGSKRHVGRGRIKDDNDKSAGWMRHVGIAALVHAPGQLLSGPLTLEVVFCVERPQRHHVADDRSRELKAGAPPYPAVRPDTTKLLRAIEDALTGVLWQDDALIVDQHAYKRYGAPERALIAVGATPSEAPDFALALGASLRAA